MAITCSMNCCLVTVSERYKGANCNNTVLPCIDCMGLYLCLCLFGLLVCGNFVLPKIKVKWFTRLCFFKKDFNCILVKWRVLFFNYCCACHGTNIFLCRKISPVVVSMWFHNHTFLKVPGDELLLHPVPR